MFDKNRIEALLGGRAVVEVFDSLPSTNTYAVQAAQSSDAPRLVIAAAQSAGRGRMGRGFYSPAGTGLYMSAVLFPECAPELFQRITPAAAVSVCKAIERQTQLEPRIKWVNDILVGGKKVCGILAESVRCGEKYAVIVGIGVNVFTSAFPAEISETAASLNCGELDVNAFAAEIFLNLADECADIAGDGVINEYRARLDTLNKEIVYVSGGERFCATAIDVNEMGNLFVSKGGKTLTLTSGEVTMHKN